MNKARLTDHRTTSAKHWAKRYSKQLIQQVKKQTKKRKFFVCGNDVQYHEISEPLTFKRRVWNINTKQQNTIE